MNRQLPLELSALLPRKKISLTRFRKRIMELSYDEMLLIFCVMRSRAHSIKIKKLQFQLDVSIRGNIRPMGTYNDPKLKALEEEIRKEQRLRDYCDQWVAALSPDTGSTAQLKEFIEKKGLKI